MLPREILANGFSLFFEFVPTLLVRFCRQRLLWNEHGMIPDAQLLNEYARDGSEAAFAELARRHVDLVYSAALRLVAGDTHLAEDVTQAVFTDLARKARALAGREMLAGWLHTSARYTACAILRAANRRRAREQTAFAMTPPAAEPEPDWEQLRPLLDEAVGSLRADDRDAVLLRFFQRKSLREVGEVLGLNENAARMRVERAVEKLRAGLARKGVTSTASTLSAVLLAHALTTAPVCLAATVSAGACMTAATTAGAAFTILKLMTLTKTKLALGSVVVIASLGIPLVIQQQSLASLRAENNALRDQARRQEEARAETAPSARPVIEEAELQRLRAERSELLRLRGEVAVLNTQLAQRTAPAARTKAPATGVADQPGEAVEKQVPRQWTLGTYLASEAWQDAGDTSPEAALQTFFWARRSGDSNRLAQITLQKRVPSDVTPEQIQQRIQAGQIRLSPAVAVTKAPPDYSQLVGGRVAYMREDSPREVQMNVDEVWPDGTKVQSVMRFRKDEEGWKYAPNVTPGR
jgi:RNA polymerase sigma factor (sigma-70 family)